MNKSQENKKRWMTAMASYVLDNGLSSASLRPLAKAAGTSDRMLIYHYGSKDGLIAELLEYLSDDMAEKLDLALPEERATSMGETINRIVQLLRAPLFGSYMKLWLEILAEAGQGNPDHQEAGKKMIGSYLEWLKKHIPEDTKDPQQTVALLLTLIEGIIVMDTMDRSDIADSAVRALVESQQ